MRTPPAAGRASEGRHPLLEPPAVLRLVTAGCYGAILLLTALTVIGVSIADTGHGAIVGGWAFCSAGLFAVGRLAHLARRDDR